MVVNEDGTIQAIEWTFKGENYKLVSTRSAGRFESVWKAVDTIKMPDKSYREFTRRELQQHFK